jgi:hypothetical protein
MLPADICKLICSFLEEGYYVKDWVKNVEPFVPYDITINSEYFHTLQSYYEYFDNKPHHIEILNEARTLIEEGKVDKITYYMWDILTQMPSAIDICERYFEEKIYRKDTIFRLDNTFFKEIGTVNLFRYFSRNPAALPFLTRNRYFHWEGLMQNPGAIDLIKRNQSIAFKHTAYARSNLELYNLVLLEDVCNVLLSIR